MTALENMLNYYNQLPPTSTTKAVLRLCFAHVKQLAETNIYELAELCYTSTATISRLVKSMGYKSYSAFQTSIAESCSRYDYHNRFSVDQFAGSLSPKEIVLENIDYISKEFEKNVSPDSLYASGGCSPQCQIRRDLLLWHSLYGMHTPVRPYHVWCLL